MNEEQLTVTVKDGGKEKNYTLYGWSLDQFNKFFTKTLPDITADSIEVSPISKAEAKEAVAA